ncbi:MAG: PorP/SprF family type IX secretion system membrane protein [Saprospiraceae bacterium]
MKKLINIFKNIELLISFGSVLQAQDYATSLKTPAVYTQYHINPILINPAYTGFEGQSQILFNFRNHWAGFDGSPKGLTLGINGSPVNNMGLGSIIYSEKFGVANRFSGQLNYAYNFKTGPDTKMSLSLSGSYIRYSLDNSALQILTTIREILSLIRRLTAKTILLLTWDTGQSLPISIDLELHYHMWYLPILAIRLLIQLSHLI